MNETKKLEYDKKPFVTDDLVEVCYQKMLEGDDRVAHLVTLERRGGECVRCGKPYAVVHVNNTYGLFDYYKPTCNCYHRCEWVYLPNGKKTYGCGKLMIIEAALGSTHCLSCYDPKWEEAERGVSKTTMVANRGRARE